MKYTGNTIIRRLGWFGFKGGTDVLAFLHIENDGRSLWRQQVNRLMRRYPLSVLLVLLVYGILLQLVAGLA